MLQLPVRWGWPRVPSEGALGHPAAPPAHGGKVSFKRTRKPALWPLSKVTTASKDQGPVQVKLKVKCVSGGGFPLWLALAKF